MEEANEGLRVVPELYFLIAKFLSGGPLKETAKTLLKELDTVEVLPRRLDWEGTEHTQSYEELQSQYPDLPWWRLAAVCQKFLSTPQRALSAEGSLSLRARLSLLSDSLVRDKPKYSAYKEDHSLVRRLSARELGCGGAGVVGGKGGEALMSPRMLSGLQLQRRTLGHLSAVYCVVFDRTGRYVLTGADDLLVKVWSAVDGRLVATLRGAGAEITDADVSRDSALLACGSVERLVRVWCLATGAPKAVLHAHARTITSVRWAPPACPDVRWLASTSTDGSVAFWTCSADGQFLSQPVQYVERMRPGACHMICAAWSAGGGFLAAGSADHHVRIYMVQGQAPRRVLEVAVHSDAVDSIAWAHRGLRLLSGSKDGSAALWTLHATQWRHTLLRCEPIDNHDNATQKLKVTMVCWDCSDAYILTAVSDKTLRVWCARACAQVRVLRGHRDEAYVLEAHPALPGVVLSAGHDGQLLVWDAPRAELLASFHNDITGQGDGAIFDAKWGGLASIAATDSHGHLLLLGLGKGHKLLQELPQELFFHTDYRPLVRDALGGALDEQTETPPHLMAPPFLVDVEGAPHPPHLQRLVAGRENLTPEHLVPANRLELMIEALAAERAGGGVGNAGGGGGGGGLGLGGGGGVWRGEGVRHTLGSWERGGAEGLPHAARTVVPPLCAAALSHVHRACAEMHAFEQAWYRREMRRRPLMISTAHDPQTRRRAARRPKERVTQPPPPRAPSPPRAPPSPGPSLSSYWSHELSDSSAHWSGSESPRRPHRARPPARQRPRGGRRARDSDDTETDCSYTSEKTEESSQSSYSDWEAGAEMAPPARAKRRPLPARRYSPSTVETKRVTEPTAGPSHAETTTNLPQTSEVGELPEAYRPGEWLCAVSPRKAPYHPQMGDVCLYFRLGHQRYFEAVAEKDVYKVNPRDKPWERTQINECEVVKVVGVKYVIKPPRIVCLRLACQSSGGQRQRIFTVKYHDMPDVIDFLVLKQQYDIATQRHWGPGDRFRCMIDDSWWTGVVVEKTGGPPTVATAGVVATGSSSAPDTPQATQASQAAAHFLSLKVRWDNGEVERLSPWDLEPIDLDRLPSEPGGAVPVLPHELEAVLYRCEPEEWPDRTRACRAIAQHISQVMSLSVAEPFVVPVDLQLYPSYAMVVPYPIDLSTIKARFDNLFYRRTVAAQFDVRYLASNAEQFNQPHSPIVRQARLVTDLLLHIISLWRSVDVVGRYHELAAAYHSSDDEPLATHATNSSRSRGRKQPAVSWREVCSSVLQELMRSPDAEPFKQPVSIEQCPDYLTVVTHPADLATISSNLHGGRYSRASRFAADVRRVFSNSRLYNTNKRSRIYSMTVRLSALFESLWSRAGLEHNAVGNGRTEAGSGRTPRKAAARTRRMLRRVITEENGGPANGKLHTSGSDSDTGSSSQETLAATSRRVHRGGKGKGVGKKSRRVDSSEPGASAHAQRTEGQEHQRGANGVATDSDDEALARIRQNSTREDKTRQEMDESDTQYTDIEVLEEELDDTTELHYEHSRQSSRKRRRITSSDSSASQGKPRTRRKPGQRKRTRERITDGSSTSSSSSAGQPAELVRRYESDHSYKPRYSTDDDAPLNVYRQRQDPGAGGDGSEPRAGPSHSGTSGRANHSAHKRGVSLRARRSPRRYNEDSEEDSIAAISKRLPHHRHREILATRRLNHATQSAGVGIGSVSRRLAGVSTVGASDHDYFNGADTRQNGRNSTPNEEDERPAVSISSRGRVRKLTAKARGLLH